MRKNIEKHNILKDEAFNRYLHAIGASIIEINKQIEGVD